MPIKKLLLAAFIASIILLYFVGGGDKYLDIHLYQGLFERSPFITATVFFIVFFVGTSFSLPVTAVLGVAGGIVFGTVIGFLISLLAVTMGGAVSLLSSRFLFHDLVQRRFEAQINVVNKGIEKEGALYVYGLRMVPVVPFAVLNLLMGLTSMRVPVFMLITFCGMLPVMLILAYTGSQLGDIETFDVASIFTPGLLLSLTLLATFPFIAKVIVTYIRRFAKTKNSQQVPKA